MKSRLAYFLYGRNKYRLIIEIGILYLVFPLLIMLDLLALPLMGILMLMGISVFCFLYYDPAFDRNTLINWKQGRRELKSVFIKFIPAAAVMVTVIWIIDAEKLFQLARTEPWLLLMISIFYPLFSVIPQGLAYRSLFFHRYGTLLRSDVSRIVTSAAFFSFGHILYRNWLVLLLAFLAGILFAWRYHRSGSLAISILEHSLYGVWLFACGLGYFFVSSFVE